MSDILLAKSKLGEGWIDASIGEAHLIKDIFLSSYGVNKDFFLDLNWEYPAPEGNKELTDILSKRYGAPVVITNGAKQGLCSVFYALKKLGCSTVGMRNPHWALIPPLVKFHGLSPIFNYNADAYLAVLPGNPDGYMMSRDEIIALEQDCKEKGKYLIHDSVYYTHTYLHESVDLIPFGDVQLYSASKMYGISGCRLGWVVCRNETFYPLIREYVEMMTVGVSEVSQKLFLENVIKPEENKPSLKKKFEKKSYFALKEARRLFSAGINRNILELSDDFEQTPGMFVWAKLNNSEAFKAAKINVIDGLHFGMPGYIRMNMALHRDTFEELISRLS